MRLFKKFHLWLKLWLIKYYRTKEVLEVFRVTHAAELKQVELQYWPALKAAHGQELLSLRAQFKQSITAVEYKQAIEIAGIRAGKLDIVDRKSWSYPYLPASVQRLAMPIAKATPYNLRRMGRTPVARRAINLVKNAVISQPWAIEALKDVDPIKDETDQKSRVRVATNIFQHPNGQDSFQSFVEQGIEDMCINGALCAEQELTPDPQRPLKMWPVCVDSIRIFASWQESTPDMPHYAQMTGMKGERGAVLFYDDELLYVKDNPSTDNPFGLGKMEVAFMSLNDFLGVQSMSGRAGTDAVHKCFPGTTEVLTRRGWMRWDQVGDDEEFATRSLDGKFQWQRSLQMVREQHDGDMIQFRSRSLTMTVTPNHRMYGRCEYRYYNKTKKTIEDLGFMEARDLYDEACYSPGPGWQRNKKHKKLHDFRVPARSDWEGGALPAPVCRVGSKTFAWEDWVAFLGIWIAEGSCATSARAKSKSDFRIQIAQSKKANAKKYKKIQQLLDRMGFKYQAKYDRFIFVDRDVWAYVVALGDSFTKYVPQWIKDAPIETIRIFFDWAMMGDGHVGHNGKRVYFTVSTRLAGDMQELFQKIGSSAAVCAPSAGTNVYTVTEMLREDISIIPKGSRGKARMPKRIPFSGMVYCATVPNGTLYVRENGYAFWSGNTFLWWEQPQSDSAYQIVRRYVQNELEGQAKLAIIGGMKKPEVVEVTPVTVDDLLLPWQELLIRMIANAFDMSAMALGVEHDVNRAVGQVLDDRDFRTAIVPLAMRLQEAFTRRVLHAKLGWTDLRFKFLNLEDPDQETKLGLLTKMYSANAATPNELRVKMGWEKLESPFADLTQFEAMMVNAQSVMELQDRQQARTMQRQLDQFQQMQDSQQQQQQDENYDTGGGQPYQYQGPAPKGSGGPGNSPGGSGGSGAGGSGGAGSTGNKGRIVAPKKLDLPKFPIAATGFNAKQIARMPVSRLQDVFLMTGVSPSMLMEEMTQQEPTILEQMSEEVRQFLEKMVELEQANKKGKVSPKALREWTDDLKKRIRKDTSRTDDFGSFLYKMGRYTGVPGKPIGKGPIPPGLKRLPAPGKPGRVDNY